VRSRPLTPHVLTASLRRLRARRAGLVAPVAVAVALAFVGHEVSTPGSSPVVASAALSPVGPVAELPERAAPRTPTSVETRGSVVPKAVKKKPSPKRASRAKVRKAAPRRNWVRPSGGALTSRYGPRWGRMHRGIDFGAPYGAPIYAAAAGTVSFAGAQGGYGRLVTVRHSGGITTAYGHMSRIVVRVGQRVSAGQVIAYVGSEGRSTGPHLHFEVRRGGAYLNPIPFLRARGVWV
jgi:murein DD-endopeptidase MepM/ murein hydrolase activator NlpD